jgi:two-component system, response regulator RegA
MSRILVIDDEEPVREAIARRLRREGYDVTIATMEAEGVSKIRESEQPYDLVITDMFMETPGSGVNVLKAALMRDVFTEVIVLTAYGNVKNAVECMKMGAFDYVEKNIPDVDVLELLCIKVEQALERRASSVNIVRKLERAGTT